ncbi:MAG: hypothetical protein HS107_15615 [Thermoflexaceae bacterium]|nr:hypothetical protein [Thermoflexaceae bacterium]
MQFEYALSADGASIACASLGSGTPVIMVPNGFGGAGISVLPRLAARHGATFTFIGYDRRGQGNSSRDFPLSRTSLAADIIAVADHFGNEAVSVWAVGTAVLDALGAALDFPERVHRLVLQSPIVGGAEWRALPNAAGWTATIEADWEYFLQSYAQYVVGWGQPGATDFASQLRRDLDRDRLRELLATYTGADYRALAAQLRLPVLVVDTTEWETHYGFPASWARDIARAIPGARVVIDHSPPNQLLTDTTMTVINEFLGPAGAAPSSPTVPRTALRTILFTDVVSSTPLLTQLKDLRMRETMRKHDGILTAAVLHHGGRVVKTIGDAFMADFPLPSDALQAAIEAQRGICSAFAGSEIPVRIRIGINAGQPIEEGGDLHGLSVVVAKRLESAAGPSGILVSDVVRQAVAGMDFTFEDRGQVDLKGIEEPVRAWSLCWE